MLTCFLCLRNSVSLNLYSLHLCLLLFEVSLVVISFIFVCCYLEFRWWFFCYLCAFHFIGSRMPRTKRTPATPKSTGVTGAKRPKRGQSGRASTATTAAASSVTASSSAPTPVADVEPAASGHPVTVSASASSASSGIGEFNAVFNSPGPNFSAPVLTAVNPATVGVTQSPLLSVCDELGAEVPLSVQEKIWKGEFVEFGSLLRPVPGDSINDCIFMVGSQESPAWQLRPHKQPRRVTSIEQWTSAFLIFASIFLKRHPEQARYLLKYADIVRSAANRRTGFGWRDYDINFRLRQARMPSRSWATIDAELWLTLVGAPVQPHINFRPYGNNGSFRQHDRNGGGGQRHSTQMLRTCHGFNRGQCARTACRYAHKCANCSSAGHAAVHCRVTRPLKPAASTSTN